MPLGVQRYLPISLMKAAYASSNAFLIPNSCCKVIPAPRQSKGLMEPLWIPSTSCLWLISKVQRKWSCYFFPSGACMFSDQCEHDLRHSLANLVAVILGSPPRSNHLWYHLFAPEMLENSYITGFMVSHGHSVCVQNHSVLLLV